MELGGGRRIKEDEREEEYGGRELPIKKMTYFCVINVILTEI